MTVLDQLAAWISADEPPLSTVGRDRLGIHVFDTVGAWLAGRATDEGKMLWRLGGSARTPVPLFGKAPLDRLAMRVASTRLTEIDDIHRASCTTPGAVVIPTALTLALQLRQPGAQRFAQALRAGYEAMIRFGIAIDGPKILYRGIWPTYLAAPLCAAAVTARLLNLDTARTADALAISLTIMSGGPGAHTGASPRWLLLGLAARAGATAALAAANGYTGDRTLLDGDWLVRTHGIALDAAALVAPMTEDGVIAMLSLKPYCAAKQTIAAIDAFRYCLDAGTALDDIVSMRVAVPPVYARMVSHRDVGASRLDRITSVAYQLALAAYCPDSLLDLARPDLTGDRQIAGLMARTEVIADEALAQHYPERWPARVEMTLRDNRTVSAQVLDAKGDPGHALDAKTVHEKFHRLADPVIGRPAAEAIAAVCLGAAVDDDALAALCASLDAMEGESNSHG